METLGFKQIEENDVSEHRSCGYKLVPWISWDEWSFVRESLFSSCPHSVDSALSIIFTWESRGCVPVVVEETASIIEIQQIDPFFRDDLTDTALISERMLARLYCMAIIRLLNGVVEETRKKTEISMAVAADAIGIPRMLIDIRHEGSHRCLSSLPMLRLASVKALDWLKAHYWETQKGAIPSKSDRTANLRKEIKSILCELDYCLKNKQPSNSPQVKGKRSKKQITKALKNFLRLYTSSSSDVVIVLLEFLLDALDSPNLEEPPNSSNMSSNTIDLHTVFDHWKPVILKLSKKEPELLRTLLKAVLEKIEAQEVTKCEIGRFVTKAELCLVEHLSSLFEWLVGLLKGLYTVQFASSAAETDGSKKSNIPNTFIMELLRKCLTLSSSGNIRLQDSAIALGNMSGKSFLIEKLSKLYSLVSSNSTIDEDNFSLGEDDYIHQAAEKIELIKLHQSKKTKDTEIINGDLVKKRRCVVVKSWNQCPIGMLPHALGSSGRVPVLDCSNDPEEPMNLSESNGKRESDYPLEVLDEQRVKKMRESEENDLIQVLEGQIMIGGIWMKVGVEELHAISPALRVVV